MRVHMPVLPNPLAARHPEFNILRTACRRPEWRNHE